MSEVINATEKFLNGETTKFRFKSNPDINVISQEEFQSRVQKVFKELHRVLSRSFGPYGSSTIIINYPYRHITKDGFTIMKSLSFNAKETLLDQAISDMAADICGRLNNVVGDGTTSAIIATNAIYQSFIDNKEELDKLGLMPRDIINSFNKLKDLIDEKLHEKVRIIRSTDPEELYKNIYDVVYISSNGDEVITKYIAELYRDLMAPSIIATKAPDGITKKLLIEGYRFECILNDKLYINSDDKTSVTDSSDVIMFSSRINEKTYKEILVPLNEECRVRGRHLIVMAPFYDEVAVRQVIRNDLIREKTDKGDINMILTTYRAGSSRARQKADDFAMLMNTTIITKELEEQILDDLKKGKSIWEIFNIDNRNIPGVKAVAVSVNPEMAKVNNAPQAITYIVGDDEESLAKNGFTPLDNGSFIRLGYATKAKIGINERDTIFTGKMYYDEVIYNATLKDAEAQLEEKVAKFAKLGTFNLEVSEAQSRLYSLKLKMGIIEVGGDSELSIALLKDQVDDAVKAAESAFNNGVVLGCNVNLIQAMNDVGYDHLNKSDDALLSILRNGFINVYKAVLSNAFANRSVDSYEDNTAFDDSVRNAMEYVTGCDKCTADKPVGLPIHVFNNLQDKYGEITVHDLIISYSIENNEVFDVSHMQFSHAVINSVETDSQILKATIDLVALLIVGNQTIITAKHEFED